MRHLLRTHGVSVAWLKEQVDIGSYDLRYVPSALQAADIYTKGFDSAEKWTANCRLISLYSPVEADIGKLVQFWKDVEASSKPFIDDSHPPHTEEVEPGFSASHTHMAGGGKSSAKQPRGGNEVLARSRSRSRGRSPATSVVRSPSSSPGPPCPPVQRRGDFPTDPPWAFARTHTRVLIEL